MLAEGCGVNLKVADGLARVVDVVSDAVEVAERAKIGTRVTDQTGGGRAESVRSPGAGDCSGADGLARGIDGHCITIDATERSEISTGITDQACAVVRKACSAALPVVEE